MNVTVSYFSKDQTVFFIAGIPVAGLENKLNLFFTSEGYKYKGKKGAGEIYSRGNQVLRVIFGAFWKYFRIYVEIKKHDDSFSVLLRKDASGLMGGAIGMAQVRKEFVRLTEAFRLYFTR